jgi:SsrA-binding protein
MSKTTDPVKLIARNKQVRRQFELLEFFEAGLVLTGSEVKSLRAGQISFKDGYVRFKKDGAWLMDVHIAPYAHSGHDGHEPERPRKLLLHSREIAVLTAKVEQKGLSVVPVRLYLKYGRIKLEIALGRGKTLHDRRDDLKNRAVTREMERELVGR